MLQGSTLTGRVLSASIVSQCISNVYNISITNTVTSGIPANVEYICSNYIT